MADSKVIPRILREHWRLLEPGEKTAKGDQFYIGDWTAISPEQYGIEVKRAVIRRRVPAVPTCETCEHFNARESGTPFSCYLGNGLPAPRANDYCSKHQLTQEARG